MVRKRRREKWKGHETDQWERRVWQNRVEEAERRGHPLNCRGGRFRGDLVLASALVTAPEKGEPESLRIRNGSIPSKNGKRVARVWVRIQGLAA